MKRYCPNCEKEYDMKITSKEQAERPVCPVCGQRMQQKDRRALPNAQGMSAGSAAGAAGTDTQPEKMIGNAMYKLLLFFWYIDGVCGIVGILAYFLSWDVVLYVDVALGIFFALLRLLIRILGGGGFPWVLSGTIGGLVIFRSLRGICLGISIALLLHFLYRVILGNLIAALVRAGSRRGSNN